MGFMDRLKGAAESVQAQTSKVGVGASAGQMDLANRAEKLMNEGVDTPATGSPAGGEPYQVTFNQYVYPSAPFAEGDHVTLKVDPSDPDVVMIFGKA